MSLARSTRGERVRCAPGRAGCFRKARCAVERAFERSRATAVIHTAYRQDGAGAWETNVTGSANVARIRAGRGPARPRIHRPRVRRDEARAVYRGRRANPVTDYGRSKAEAEREVRSAHPDALVVRTSLLLGGASPGRHERAALALARGEAEMDLFDDELRSAVLVDDLAAALVELAGRRESGVLHVAGPEPVSRYELACLIAAAHGLPTGRLRRGSLAGLGLERPSNCVLDSTRAYTLLCTPIRGISERRRSRGAG